MPTTQQAAPRTHATLSEIQHAGIHLRIIPGYDDAYYAGEDGHVYSLKSGIPRRLRETIPKRWKGLRCVTLYSQDVRYQRRLKSGRVTSAVRPQPKYVHQLIAAAWLPPRPSPAHELDHEDEDRRNNRPTNLRWLTKRQNVQAYRWNHPLFQRGSDNASAKLTEANIPEIRALKGVRTVRDVAAMFGVTVCTISYVWSRRTWRHVP